MSFLQEDLIDELSIVMAPVTMLEKADYLPEHSPDAFNLKDVDKLTGGVLWIRYTRKMIKSVFVQDSPHHPL